MNTINILALNIPLVFIMFGLGCTLTLNDFKKLFYNPKPVLIGLISQLIIVPTASMVIISAVKLPEEIAFGVLLVTFCPGGPVSNLVSHLCNGDVALSVSLTSISSILCVATTPIWILIAKTLLHAETIQNVNLFSISLALLLIVVVPIYIGMIIKNKYPIFSRSIQGYVKIASVIILLSAILILIITKQSELLTLIKQAGIIVLIIHFINLILGYTVAKIFKLSRQHQLTVAIESGYQNNTLAIVLATTIFESVNISIPGILYGLIKSVSAIILYFFSKRILKI